MITVRPSTGSAKRAVFLDRDGVICQDGYISSKNHLKFLPDAGKAIRILNELNVPVIVVTNQPVVARGECTEDEVKDIHEFMKAELAKGGAKIDAIYYCPHHPEKRDDLPEWAKKYRTDCDCRKPKTGMLLHAAKEHGIDLKKSWIIGDHFRDIEAGKRAGCKTILVETGEINKGGASPDARCKDILEAAELLKKLFEMPAVILVGGRGERLRPLTDSAPKPLLPVAGRPVIEWQVELLKSHGVKKVVMCGHYLLGKIAEYFGDGSKFGVQIEYVDDGPQPLGSGGALKNLIGKIDTDFILLNGDVMTTLDVSSVALYHITYKALATMVVRKTDHPQDSDIIQMSGDGRAVRFFPKNESEKVGDLGNTGAFVINPKVIESIEKVPCSLEAEVLANLIKRGENIRCYLSQDYFKDMGTPERYERVQKDFSNITSLIDERL